MKDRRTDALGVPLPTPQTHADDPTIPPTLTELTALALAFLQLDARYDDLTEEAAAAKVALRVAVEACANRPGAPGYGELLAALCGCVEALEAAGADGDPGDMPAPALDNARLLLARLDDTQPDDTPRPIATPPASRYAVGNRITLDDGPTFEKMANGEWRKTCPRCDKVHEGNCESQYYDAERGL